MAEKKPTTAEATTEKKTGGEDKPQKIETRGKKKPPGYKPTNGFKSTAEWDAENLKPGENSRFIRNAMLVAGLPPIDISDEKQVEERIVWYFDHCAQEDVKPTMAGLALALGVDATTVTSWKREEYRAATHSPVIKRAYGIMHALWQDYMQNGKINPVAGVYLGANMFGYQNTNNVVIQQEHSEPEIPREALEAKYRDAIMAEGEATIESTAVDSSDY